MTLDFDSTTTDRGANNISVPSFVHLQNRDNCSHLVGTFWGFGITRQAESSAQCLPLEILKNAIPTPARTRKTYSPIFSLGLGGLEPGSGDRESYGWVHKTQCDLAGRSGGGWDSREEGQYQSPTGMGMVAERRGCAHE